ncbi:MAG: flagellar export protein FliJ [Sulfuritalea sp.]|nr:flagellar export protein FliJ [Sulfuritalea sp.]
MSKRFHLKSVHELSGLRLDQAARQLGQLIAGERQDGQRLALLLQYREEYQTLFLAAAGEGLDPRRWQNYQKFLAKLDEAVDQARALAHSARQRTAAGQQHWIEQRGKVRAFDTLAQRFRARIAYEETRRDQKQADEHTARFVDGARKTE